MLIASVGVNYAGTPLALRERLAIPAALLPAALAQLRAACGEGFILSTCNRTEVVALLDAGEADTSALVRFLAGACGVDAEMLAPHLHTRTQAQAIRHLFGVAAGLDSLVLGEDQIQGQLRGALDAAAGMLGPTLRRLGQAALATGKRVRAETAIGRGNASVVSAALRLAGDQLGTLSGRTVLILGAGETAELVLKHLAKDRRVRPLRVMIANRTDATARSLAARYGVEVVPWAGRESALADADLAIGCTAAPGVVIAADAAARALAARPDRALLCLDLAVPRDFAPVVGALPGVTLRDLDDLATRCAAARDERREAIAAAEAIVAAEVAAFLAWWRGRAVAPAIVALRDHAEALRDAEVDRALARLPGLDPREEAIVRDLAAGLVNKLLHRPTMALKTSPDGVGLASAVGDLFGLAGAAQPGPPPTTGAAH